MKRFLIIVTILGMTAVAAQAQTKGKTAQTANSALPPCCQTGGESSKVTSEQIQKFLDATVQLRQDLFGKNAEYQALLKATNPDPKQAGEIAREIFDLRTKIAAEAAKQGFPQMGMMGMGESGMGGCGMMSGSGMGGGMMGGKGMSGSGMTGGTGMGAAAK
jgi:zinc resistance-associated protein